MSTLFHYFNNIHLRFVNINVIINDDDTTTAMTAACLCWAHANNDIKSSQVKFNHQLCGQNGWI